VGCASHSSQHYLLPQQISEGAKKTRTLPWGGVNAMYLKKADSKLFGIAILLI
jgi:hypothetical protein